MKKKKSSVAIPSSVAVLVPCEYAERDGVAHTYEEGTAVGRPVKVMSESDVLEYAAAERADRGWVDFIYGVRKLLDPERRPDDSIVVAEAYELMAPYLSLKRSPIPPKNFDTAYLLPSLGMAFAGVRLTFWNSRPNRDGGIKLRSGLYCADVKTSVATRMLLGDGLRVCTNCNNIFHAVRPKQSACSVKCRESHRVARWYRNKEANKRKKASAARKEAEA